MFLSKVFGVTVPKNFVGEPFRVSLVLGIKKVCLRGLCHVFLYSSFVSQYRKTLQGNPSVLCFRKFPVGNRFMEKKGESTKSFHRKFFDVTMPKNFVEEPFSVSLVPGIEKNYA